MPKELTHDKRDNAYRAILRRLMEDTLNVWPFLGPVPDHVEFYCDTIEFPICLADVQQKVQQNEYHH
ncbi:hypothetical protein AAVH_27435, partial [Aphelenchoides avenae]